MFDFANLNSKMIARFWSKVDRGGGADACWPFIGGRKKVGGYGTFFAERRPIGRYGTPQAVNAHKFAYVVTNGLVPDGLVVRHKCDNPPCCNPDHLLIGTPSDNIRDAIERGRIKPLVGEERMRLRNYVIAHRQFTEADVIAIFLARVQGETATSIARRYSISSRLISLIFAGGIYTDFPFVQRLGKLHHKGIRFPNYQGGSRVGRVIPPEMHALAAELF